MNGDKTKEKTFKIEEIITYLIFKAILGALGFLTVVTAISSVFAPVSETIIDYIIILALYILGTYIENNYLRWRVEYFSKNEIKTTYNGEFLSLLKRTYIFAIGTVVYALLIKLLFFIITTNVKDTTTPLITLMRNPFKNYKKVIRYDYTNLIDELSGIRDTTEFTTLTLILIGLPIIMFIYKSLKTLIVMRYVRKNMILENISNKN